MNGDQLIIQSINQSTTLPHNQSINFTCCLRVFAQLYNLQGYQTQNVFIFAYLQSWVYFTDVMADIRRMFTFRPHIVSEVNKYYDSLLRSNNSHSISRQQSDYDSSRIEINIAKESTDNGNVETTQPVETYVGVHVRRGDMTQNEKLQDYGFQTGGPDFVKRAMLYYIQRYSHVTFIVCSDDISWCRQNIALNQSDIMSLKSDSNNNNDIRVNIHFCNETQPDYVHLAVLAACNHSIICGGTFGWWSAFLAGGEAVYYKDYPRPGSRMERGFSPTKVDHYLPGWIGM
jgi:galactoside 2-L-fucosyltransferase 1/2